VIENATLSSISVPVAADKFGDVVPVAARLVSIRCNLQDLSLRQRIALETIAKDLTGVLRVLKSSLPSGVAPPAKDGRVVVTLDGGGAVTTYEVAETDNAEKAGGLSHYKYFLRRVSA
jgi:hypothetical protein